MDEHFHGEVDAMILAAEQFIYRCLCADVQPRLLILCGRNGVGKSTVARSIVRAVGLLGVTSWHVGRCPKPPSASEFTWNQLAGMTHGDRKAEMLWTEAIEHDLVLLDDVGAEVDRFKNQQPAENLRLILEERRHLWTVITTNIPPEHWVTIWDQRVEDRLHRHSIIVALPTAPSYLRR